MPEMTAYTYVIKPFNPAFYRVTVVLQHHLYRNPVIPLLWRRPGLRAGKGHDAFKSAGMLGSLLVIAAY